MNFLEKRLLYIDLNKAITIDNLNKYYLTVARLYNEGNYSEALKGFRKLIDFCEEFRFYLMPYIDKCENVLKKPYQKKKFSLIKKIRCKHCGYPNKLFTGEHKYHPHHFLHATAFDNECFYCGTSQPEPSIIWDSWDGLKDADNLRDNFNQLIDKYSIEYNEWLKYRKSPDIYESFCSVGNPEWINYQIKILRNIYKQTQNNEGYKLFSLGHNEEALKVFEKAVELNPDDANAWNNMGNTLKRLGRHEEAFEAHNKAAKAFYKKGQHALKSFRYEDALKAFNKAIELSPDNVDMWLIKGQTLEKLRRYEEALNAYERAIELSPDNADVWLDKGHALRELGRHEESLYAYDKAVKLTPDDSYYWFFRGTALINLKRYEEAQKANDKAIELDPDNIFAPYQRAQIFSLKNDKENAVRSLSIAINLYSRFREEAIKDTSFQKFWNDEDFKKITQ